MQHRKIRLIVCDDHPLVRKGLVSLLSFNSSIEVVGEASDGKSAISMAAEQDPDVVLTDIEMPEMNGIEVAGELSRKHPDIKVIILTAYDDNSLIYDAIKAGAVAYLLKDSKPEHIFEIIERAYSGESVVDDVIARCILEEMIRRSKQTDEPDAARLTPKEQEVLRLLARGLTNSEIADELVVAPSTVKSHVAGIMTKLRLRNRVEAAVYAISSGIADAR